MLSTQILKENMLPKQGESVRDLLNTELAPKGESISEAEFHQVFATFSAPAGGAFLIIADGETPVGIAGYRKLQDTTCLFGHYFVVASVDSGIQASLLRRLFVNASMDGYEKIRITSELLANRQIRDFVVTYQKNILQGTQLEFIPSQETFDIPLV